MNTASARSRRVRDGAYDAAVLAVGHKEFRDQGIASIRKACKKNHVVYDIKYRVPRRPGRWPSVRTYA